jgi:phosphatidate cytidylyltransferase
MQARVLTALAGITCLLILIGFGRPWQFSLFIFILTLGALCEYFFIAFPGQWRERVLGIFFGVVISLMVLYPLLPDPGLILAGVIIGAFSVNLFFEGELEERFQHLGWTVIGVFYIGYLFPHFALIYRGPSGTEWVFFVLLVVMVGDTAGYLMGMALGRRKLYPSISPGKTVVGALSSLGASVLAGLLGAMFFFSNLSWVEVFMLSLILSLLGQVGDLFESWIKRVFSVKDSGRILPGHGGLLDRLDSLIFPAVFTAYYVRLLHS